MRDRLLLNYHLLTDLIQFDDLAPFLLQRAIIDQKQYDEIEGRQFDDDEPKVVNAARNKCLLDLFIHNRFSDEEYDKLVECLIETGHSHAAKMLKPESDLAAYGSSSLSSYTETGDEMPHLKVKLCETHKTGPKYYKMTSKPRGFCLIVNNVDFEHRPEEKRLGSDKDAERMSTVFNELGFDVILQRNVESFPILEFLRSYASREDELSQHDALVVVVLSHGDAEEIFGTDNLRVNIRDILEIFNNVNCRQLRGKPKMFFFAACRGDRKDQSISTDLEGSYDAATFEEVKKVSSEETKINAKNLGPSYSDMIISYSTVYGFVSHRNPTSGSWYCETLAQMLVEHSCDTRLIDLLGLVDNLVQARLSEQGCNQTTSYEAIGFNKKLYFNPGYYEGAEQCE